MQLPSKFQIGDNVMYNTETSSTPVTIIAVKFTATKVFYDFLDPGEANTCSGLEEYCFASL